MSGTAYRGGVKRLTHRRRLFRAADCPDLHTSAETLKYAGGLKRPEFTVACAVSWQGTPMRYWVAVRFAAGWLEWFFFDVREWGATECDLYGAAKLVREHFGLFSRRALKLVPGGAK